MTVVLELELVLRLALDVHVTGVPVARLRLALRPPVCPDAELGVAKPLRCLILLERFPGGLEPARLHRLVSLVDWRRERRRRLRRCNCRRTAACQDKCKRE